MAGLGHIAVGMAAAKVLRREPSVSIGFARAAVVLSALSMAPDLDVIGFAFGIPYEAPLGHRGASHSVVAAIVIGLLCAAIPGWGGASRRRVFAIVAATVASHGLLDTLTDGGRGVALLWPFDVARYFAPVRPIPVSPIGAGLLSIRGGYVVLVELVVFAPLWAWSLTQRRRVTDLS